MLEILAANIDDIIIAGTSAHLRDVGLLGPSLTLGHGVWLTQSDLDLVAESGTLRVPRTSAEARRIGLSKEVLPHVKRFYQDEDYLDETDGAPFYRFNCQSTPP